MTTTDKQTLKSELMAILGCVKETSIASRLRKIGLLECCTRCGGSGHYSYCQMHGTTCFKCNGRGEQMPIFTAKLVKAARDKWTSEIAAAYAAEQSNIAECRKIVNNARSLYINAKCHVAMKEARPAELKHWMEQSEWEKVNRPVLCEIISRLYAIQQKIDAVLKNVNSVNGKEWNPTKRVYELADFAAIRARIAPLLEEFTTIDVPVAC